MSTCEQLKKEYLEGLNEIMTTLKERANGLKADGAVDEAILENIKLNIYDIFFTLFNVSYKKSCLKPNDEQENLEALSKAYFAFFDKIPTPWKEKMIKDKEHNMMEEYYKEELKLETAEEIKNIFIKYYDKFKEE